MVHSLYTATSTTVKDLQGQLKKYDTSKGTIRFPPNKPLPATLVKKIIKIKMSAIKG